jgi:signal transduction histidine kinase
MRFFSCVLLTVLFLSCANQNKSPTIQDIIDQWTDIDRHFTENGAGLIGASAGALTEATGVFYQSLQQFQKSDLYRTYRTIPYSPQTERSFSLHFSSDIQEVRIASDLALIFRDSIVSGDMEKARAVSAEISGSLIRLLAIDADTQRYIGSSYFNLLVTLIVFIVIIALLIWFLHQSLTRSLKREAEGTFFSHSYMIAQDEERSRISRELHDTIIQDIRCLLLETEKIGNTDDRNEREKLSGKTVPMMAGLIRKTRDICNGLIPPDFRFSELPDALRQLCLDFGEKTGIDCRAEIEGNVKLEFLTMEKKLQVFRIVQEALANIEKHAGAKEAIVTMRTGQNGVGSFVVFVGIGDDGKGFIPPLDKNGQIISGIDKSHIGIISMKERAAILGGNLKIESEPGEGALVCLEFVPPQKETLDESVVN